MFRGKYTAYNERLINESEVYSMNDTLTLEIVRLVREIANDEKEIRFAQDAAATTFSDSAKTKYADKIKMYKESLERKYELLRLLNN